MQFKWRLSDYQSPSAAQDKPLYPWYTATDIDMASLPAGVELGQAFWQKDGSRNGGGNCYGWVKATVGLTVGQLVALAAPGTDTASTGSTTSVLTLTTGALTVSAEIGNYVFVDGTNKDFRRIKANAAATISVALPDQYVASLPADPDIFTAAPVSTNPVAIIRPWNVRVNTASLQPIGVALGTVTSGNYTVIQIAGVGLVSATGSGTALVVGVPAAGGAAGVIVGQPANYATAQYFTAGGSITPLYALAGANQLIPALFNFTGA